MKQQTANLKQLNTLKGVINKDNAFGPAPDGFVKVIHNTLNSLDTKGTTKAPYAERNHPIRNKQKSPRK